MPSEKEENTATADDDQKENPVNTSASSDVKEAKGEAVNVEEDPDATIEIDDANKEKPEPEPAAKAIPVARKSTSVLDSLEPIDDDDDPIPVPAAQIDDDERQQQQQQSEEGDGGDDDNDEAADGEQDTKTAELKPEPKTTKKLAPEPESVRRKAKQDRTPSSQSKTAVARVSKGDTVLRKGQRAFRALVAGVVSENDSKLKTNGKRSRDYLKTEGGSKRAKITLSTKPIKGKFPDIRFQDLERTAKRLYGDFGDDPRSPEVENITIEIENDEALEGASSKPALAVLGDGETSNSLRIDGFKRPFRESQVRELLDKYGTVTYMWMDNIKTHCYVMYETETEAIACCKSVHGLQWPEDSVATLSARHVTDEEATDAARPSKRKIRDHEETNREEPEKKLKTLDELFRRTKAKPSLYWLPLSEEEILQKQRRLGLTSGRTRRH